VVFFFSIIASVGSALVLKTSSVSCVIHFLVFLSTAPLIIFLSLLLTDGEAKEMGGLLESCLLAAGWQDLTAWGL
jgi:hypothetical protein